MNGSLHGTDAISDTLANAGVHTFTKDILRVALTKDALDAYRDVQLAADLLKARFDEMTATTRASVTAWNEAAKAGR